MRPLVSAVVTYQRPAELRRLLRSLAASTTRPDRCIIADHSPTGPERGVTDGLPFPVEILEDPSNPGPGAGWAGAAARHPEADVLFLDDDVVLSPGAIERMRACLGPLGMVAPLLEDEKGQLWGFPEPRDRDQRHLIRRAETPGAALQSLGPGPHSMVWCTGACVLVSAGLREKIGGHRRDFWMLGEDLEYSLRAAHAGTAVFICDVVIPHLPPGGAVDPVGARIKFCSLLQNLCYLSTRCPHSAHMIRYLPGNFRRYFRTFGWTPASLSESIRCFVGGVLLGEPSGGPLGSALRKRLRQQP